MQIQNATLVPSSGTLNVLVDPYRLRIDEALERALSASPFPMYGMLRYFMGYESADGMPTAVSTGKRVRPALLMYVADACGGSSHALNLAVAVELFHNFTLIHDDIVDNDEMRRSRATVWKVWGINHAINAGDAQVLLSNRFLTEVAAKDPGQGSKAANLLQSKFLEVTEGQYLDFILTEKNLDDASVNEEAYLDMIRKKTSVLVGASAAAGGLVAGCDEKVADDLYVFGETLGLAYQIADDMVSVWGDSAKSGKESFGDIIERKKTLPLLYAYANSPKRPRLLELYGRQTSLAKAEVEEVVQIFNESGAYEASKKHALFYMNEAKAAIDRLSIDSDFKLALKGIVDAFVQLPPPSHA